MSGLPRHQPPEPDPIRTLDKRNTLDENTEMKTNGSTVLKPHPCVSTFQDKMYGRGVRVFNIGKDDSATCTVCAPSARTKRLTTHASGWKPIHGGAKA